MKTLLNLAFIAISLSGFCQDYQPFDENIPKRFNDINNPAEADYFFYALDIQVSNDTTYFNQYIKKDFANIVPIGNSRWKKSWNDRLYQYFQFSNNRANVNAKRSTSSNNWELPINV